MCQCTIAKPGNDVGCTQNHDVPCPSELDGSKSQGSRQKTLWIVPFLGEDGCTAREECILHRSATVAEASGRLDLANARVFCRKISREEPVDLPE